jgi:hypothetical protein
LQELATLAALGLVVAALLRDANTLGARATVRSLGAAAAKANVPPPREIAAEAAGWAAMTNAAVYLCLFSVAAYATPNFEEIVPALAGYRLVTAAVSMVAPAVAVAAHRRGVV